MAEVFRFPDNGYDVTIMKKKDILDCIEANITDKEVALAIVTQCELDASKYISEGKWAGIPFMGSFKVPAAKKMLASTEQQTLINEAKENLTTEKYVMFRKQLNADNAKKIRLQNHYNYIVNRSINSHRKLYNRLVKLKGEPYANLYMFGLGSIVAVENECIDL